MPRDLAQQTAVVGPRADLPLVDLIRVCAEMVRGDTFNRARIASISHLAEIKASSASASLQVLAVMMASCRLVGDARRIGSADSVAA